MSLFNRISSSVVVSNSRVEVALSRVTDAQTRIAVAAEQMALDSEQVATATEKLALGNARHLGIADAKEFMVKVEQVESGVVLSSPNGMFASMFAPATPALPALVVSDELCGQPTSKGEPCKMKKGSCRHHS